jgi:replicative DNA helicase
MGATEDAAALDALQGLEGAALTAKLAELVQDRAQAANAKPPEELLRPINTKAAFALARARRAGEQRAISTPWPDVNQELPGGPGGAGGLWPGCYVLVGGTGTGRTTLALQLAEHAAKQDGAKCAYVALEMDEPQTVLRIACTRAQLSWSKALTGQLDEDELERAERAAEDMSEWLLFEEGGPMGWPWPRISAVAKAARDKALPNQPVLVIVDFLQLVGAEPGEGRQELRERIGKAAYAAREAARRLGVVVLLISSTARSNYADLVANAGLKLDTVRDGGTEHVASRYMTNRDAIVGLGKESGEIEFSADGVLVLMKVDYKPGEQLCVLAIPKQRISAEGWASLLFDGQHFKSDPSHGRSVRDALEETKADTPRNGAAKPPKPSAGPRIPVAT